MTDRSLRAEQVGVTREAILTAAEKLYAENGVFAVSNRQVCEAAGQGNNAAVGYHFGTKTDLVRAILRKHSGHVERLRREVVAVQGDSTDVRDWVKCLVTPHTEHLASLGSPTWYARFSAQLMPDPAHRDVLVEESLASPSLLRIVDGFNRSLPDMPADVRLERSGMARQLIVHVCAERERDVALGALVPRPTWAAASIGLIDAISGMFLAPITAQR